jgi:hypothetical protein
VLQAVISVGLELLTLGVPLFSLEVRMVSGLGLSMAFYFVHYALLVGGKSVGWAIDDSVRLALRKPLEVLLWLVAMGVVSLVALLVAAVVAVPPALVALTLLAGGTGLLGSALAALLLLVGTILALLVFTFSRLFTIGTLAAVYGYLASARSGRRR